MCYLSLATYALSCQAWMSLDQYLKPFGQQVNAGVEHMRGVCEMMGVLTLPYFIVYNSGEVVDRFSLNLTRVDKLRSAVAGLAPACDKVAKLQVLLP